jgi:hypothetical protein
VQRDTEIRERILNAAQQLFEASGRLELPTVDAVRRLSKTNMNDASAVMKEMELRSEMQPSCSNFLLLTALCRQMHFLEKFSVSRIVVQIFE